MKKIEKREIRDASFTVRIRKSTLKKIKELATKNHVSQATVIEQLVNEAFEEDK